MQIGHKLYDAAAMTVAFGATAVGLLRRPVERRGQWVRERFGLVDYGARDIWVHAVSVGESMAAFPLLDELSRRRQGLRWLFTTVTETGRQVASARLGEERVATIPWDVGTILDRVLARTGVRAVVTLETELWPAFIRVTRQRGIPFLIVNGRISDRSYGGYLRARRFMRSVFRGVGGFGMQTERDASRVVSLGADPASVAVLGNLKYDVRIPPGGPPPWMRGMKGKVWVVGSTHKGEDEIVLDAYELAAARVSDLQLVLAPRHPERFDSVASLVRSRGLSLTRCSEMGKGQATGGISEHVVLLDVMGELSRVYGGGQVCLVGGSLVPSGGHNILEAVVWEKPVIVGPFVDNFAEMVSLFEGAGGVTRVCNSKELADAVVKFVVDRGQGDAQAAKASAVLVEHRGAAQRTADWIESRVALSA